MVTGPTSTKDKKVKKGKKTKKRKHHETTGSDSEHQQSSEKKKKSKKTKKVHHQKKPKEESGDAQAEPKDDEAPSEKAEANQQSPPKKADLYAGLSPPRESAEGNAEDLVSREAQQLEAVVQIAVQASRPEQPPGLATIINFLQFAFCKKIDLPITQINGLENIMFSFVSLPSISTYPVSDPDPERVF